MSTEAQATTLLAIRVTSRENAVLWSNREHGSTVKRSNCLLSISHGSLAGRSEVRQTVMELVNTNTARRILQCAATWVLDGWRQEVEYSTKIPCTFRDLPVSGPKPAKQFRKNSGSSPRVPSPSNAAPPCASSSMPCINDARWP